MATSLTSATTTSEAAEIGPPRAKSLRLGERTGDAELFSIVPRSASGPDGATAPALTPVSLSGARAVSRALARETPKEQIAALFEEHSALVDKAVDEPLSRREQARLAYVRWQIDRLEDAQVGERLDALEDLTTLHEAIAGEVTRFVAQVRDLSRPRRGHR